MSSYFPAILLSLIGHSVLVILVMWGWSITETSTQVTPPTYIKATLVQLEEKATPKPQVAPKPQPKPEPKPVPKKNDDAEKKKLAEQKRAEQQRIKEAEAKKAEQARKNQLAKEKKAEEQRKAEEEKKRQQALEEQQQEQRRQELLKELEAERQRELERAIANEKALLEAQQQARQDQETAQSYIGVIHEKVTANWSRPPSARNGMIVVLNIQLVPTGSVVSVEIRESSGDNAFDRSAVRAVEKAESFPELRQLSSRVFEQNFRVFNLKFSPEDLRQ